MKTLILFALALAALPGCQPYYGRLAEFSSAELSCTEEEVEISDAYSTRAAARYTARCRDGKAYRCITMIKPYPAEPETTCQPMGADSEETVANASSSQSSAGAPRGILPGGWPRVRIHACQAELTMPPDAKLLESIEPTSGIAMREARAHAGESAFNFSCAQLPQLSGEPGKADEVVAGAVNGALQAISGEVISSRKLPEGTGRSLLVRVQGARMALRVWTQGEWLYSASVVPIDSLPDGAVAEYLDRITVPKPAR
jgi:hypothetical protein